MGKRIVLVAVNDQGRRIGMSHHNARISDTVVAAIRLSHERDGVGYRQLARIHGLSRHTVAKLCRYERRWQMPFAWKRVVVDDDDG
jgi:hypothetical protein